MKGLSDREREILGLLVSEYISTAIPIGSETIVKKGGLSLSSATIRNVLARLEELGLLTHPHTSAGRVPTTAGFRYFVNTIVKRHELTKEERSTISEYLKNSGGNIEGVLKKTGAILSYISNYTGLVVMPKLDNVVLKHIEFLPISTGRILGIFVSRDGIVHNRVIEIGDDFSYLDLEKISNYCNRFFYGLTLSSIRGKAIRELDQEKARYDRLVNSALLWSKEMFEGTTDGDLLVEGEAHLFGEPEFTNVEELKKVVEALEEKKKLAHLLNRAVEGDEVCVFIGSESGYKAVSNCSIVTAAYKKAGEIVGTIGVIGPRRMDYSRVIPTVDFTASLVSQMLEGRVT